MRRGNGETESGTGGSETGYDGLYSIDGGSSGKVSRGFSETKNPLTGVRLSEFENREVNKTMEECTDGFCPMPSLEKPLHFFDPVDKPMHYAAGAVECIDAIEAQLTPEEFRGYLKGNVARYMWRERKKGGTESLKKANWYLNRLINLNG